MRSIKANLLTCLLLVGSVALVTAQRWGNKVRGEGPTITKSLAVKNFHKISLAVSGDVVLKKRRSI